MESVKESAESKQSTEVHTMEDKKVRPLGLIPSLPLYITLTWYILVLLYGIVCTFIPTNFTINVGQNSTGIGLIFLRMICYMMQSWLWVIGIFGGIATFFRKELNIFYSGFTVLSITVVVISTLGFIGG